MGNYFGNHPSHGRASTSPTLISEVGNLSASTVGSIGRPSTQTLVFRCVPITIYVNLQAEIVSSIGVNPKLDRLPKKRGSSGPCS